jgi:hypothetical protein
LTTPQPARCFSSLSSPIPARSLSLKAAIAEGIVPGGGASPSSAPRLPSRPWRGARKATSGPASTCSPGPSRSRRGRSPRTPASTRAWPSTAPARGAAGFGLDAASGEYVDLVGAGIIDPTKGRSRRLAEGRLRRRHAASRRGNDTERQDEKICPRRQPASGSPAARCGTGHSPGRDQSYPGVPRSGGRSALAVACAAPRSCSPRTPPRGAPS